MSSLSTIFFYLNGNLHGLPEKSSPPESVSQGNCRSSVLWWIYVKRFFLGVVKLRIQVLKYADDVSFQLSISSRNHGFGVSYMYFLQKEIEGNSTLGTTSSVLNGIYCNGDIRALLQIKNAEIYFRRKKPRRWNV